MSKAASSPLCVIQNNMAIGMHTGMAPSGAAVLLPVLLQPKLSCNAAGGSERVDESAVGVL